MKRAIKNISSTLFSAVQVVVDGLSSARQIVDFTSVPWVKYASCCGGLVEGEIYRKNIVEAYEKFDWLGRKALLDYLIIRQFENELEEILKIEKEFIGDLKSFCNELTGNRELKLDPNLFVEGRLSLYGSHLSIENNLVNLREYLFTTESPTSVLAKKFGNLEKEFITLQSDYSYVFVKSYTANSAFLQDNAFSETEKAIQEQEEAKKRLKILREIVIDRVLDTEKKDLARNDPGADDDKNRITDRVFQKIYDDINPFLIQKLQEKLFGSTLKLWFLRFGSLFSVATGIATGIVTFYTFPIVLTGLGLSLSLTALSAIMWPLAILAAVSYGILIYNTLSDLIINERLTTWWHALKAEIKDEYGRPHVFKTALLIIGKTLAQFFIKLVNWLKLQPGESYFIFSVRISLSLLVLVCGVISALTVGYTAFVQLQSYVSFAVCIMTALPLLFSDLIFSLKNSFDSINLLTGFSLSNLKDPIAACWHKFLEQLSTENYLQVALHIFRLPFKLLLTVFKLAIFLLHVFFISVASDRFFSFPCWLTLLFTMGSELLTDLCPLFGKNKNTEHAHDHEHGGLFNWIAKLIFILPATAIGILNSLFSQVNRWSANDERRVLSPWAAIQQEWYQFDIRHTHREQENEAVMAIAQEMQMQLPKFVVFQKAIKICDKQIKRLNNSFFKTNEAEEKKTIFSDYKESLKMAYKTSGSGVPIIEENKKTVLAQSRFFRCSETTSIRKINKIYQLFKINDDIHSVTSTSSFDSNLVYRGI